MLSGWRTRRSMAQRSDGGGGLVARHQQRHQLVAQLLVRHATAILVTRLDQHRQHVVALLEVGGAPAARRSPRRAARSPGAIDAAERGHADSRYGPITAIVAMRRGSEPQASTSREGRLRAGARSAMWSSRHPEHGAPHHLEGDRLHARPQLDRAARRPGLHLAVGHARPSSPRSGASARRGTVGASSLRCAMCGCSSSSGTRVAAEDGEQHHVRLAGVQQPGVAGEHLLHRVGVGEEHPGPSCTRRRVNMSP